MLLIRILVAMAVTYILGMIMPGIYVENWTAALVFSVILILVNITVGRLVKFLGCIVQLITFGLFGLFVNVYILQFIATNIDGIEIANWGSALVLSMAISFISWITVDDSRRQRDQDRRNVRNRNRYD